MGDARLVRSVSDGIASLRASNRLGEICRDGRVVDYGGLVRSVSDGIANAFA